MEEENKMEKKGRVCVTGGTGFIASWLIKRLLQDGYSVNATIRPSSNPDLDEPESFTAPIEGCIGVFHLADPVDLEGKETEEANIKKSVGGTTGILQACLNSKTVKRVVYTSSGSTVMINKKDQVDETIWSNVDFMRTKFARKLVARYAITKMSAERAALEFAEKNGLDLVSIIPTWVHGPFICPSLPNSCRSSMALIFGHTEAYSRLLRTYFVHTDDLARAYIFLFEYPNARGRYICSAVDLTLEKLSECLSARYPEYPIPTPDSLKGITGFPYAVVSSQKLLDTGFKYNYGIEEMFDGAIECCKQKGFL